MDRYQRTVYGVVFRRLGNAAEAQEVCQEAFLRAMRKLHQLRDALLASLNGPDDAPAPVPAAKRRRVAEGAALDPPGALPLDPTRGRWPP